MATESATTTYLISEPFDLAIKSLRKVLADADLKLVGELGMSGRIRDRLLISIAPYRLLFVSATQTALQELGADPRVAALTPLHIVVSARGSQTEFHLLRALPVHDSPLDRPATEIFRQLQAKISQAVERIAMRATLGG